VPSTINSTTMSSALATPHYRNSLGKNIAGRTRMQQYGMNLQATGRFLCQPAEAEGSWTRLPRSIRVKVLRKISRRSTAHRALRFSLPSSSPLHSRRLSEPMFTEIGTGSLGKFDWEISRRHSTATSHGSNTPSSPSRQLLQWWLLRRCYCRPSGER
jgi:hypothetical protein